MFEITMVLLTKSSKHGGFCVAGINCETHEWVRLVSKSANNFGYYDGHISESFMTDSNGRVCKCLDVIKVQCETYTNDPLQPENVLVADYKKIEYVDSMKLQSVLDMRPCDNKAYIYFDNKPSVPSDAINNLEYSLMLVKVDNIHIYKHTNCEGKRKTKVRFNYKGIKYDMMSVTDPDFYQYDDYDFGSGVLVVSIGKPFNDYHYKYVAKIYSCKAAA